MGHISKRGAQNQSGRHLSLFPQEASDELSYMVLLPELRRNPLVDKFSTRLDVERYEKDSNIHPS